MKKSTIALMGVLAMLVAAGCGTEEKKEEVTKPPVEALTEIPESTEEVTPTEDAEITIPEQEDGEYPYEVQFTGKDEVTEEKDGDFVYFKSEIHYPVFEGKNADNMNRFVESVIDEFRVEVQNSKENAALDYADFKAGDYPNMLFQEVETFTVSCLWGKEQRQVLFTNWYTDAGGAHPSTVCKAYVVNVTNGEPETLESVLEPYGVKKEDVLRYVAEEVQKEYNEELYQYDNWSDFEKEIARLVEQNQWYLTERGIMFFFNAYDIASYAYGSITYEIPYEVLEEGLKK